jgi:hypothetical protein
MNAPLRTHNKSLVIGRLTNSWEALKAADQFAEARVDLIVIVNVAFPNGHVFSTLATHPNLSKTPIAIAAEPEPKSKDWATNARSIVFSSAVSDRMLFHEVSEKYHSLDTGTFVLSV